MSLQLNQQAREKMIAEDIKWLLKQEPCLERGHILEILGDTVGTYYDKHGDEVNGKVINYLTLRDCNRVAKEGCLWIIDREWFMPVGTEAEVTEESFKTETLYEVHQGMTQDYIMDMRINHPEKLERLHGEGNWSSHLHNCLNTIGTKHILTTWRAGKYREVDTL